MKSALTLLELVGRQNRHTNWELVERIPLAFPTYHPQGLAFVGDDIFLSSVEVLEKPLNVFDLTLSTPGRGIGHMFVIDKTGKLLKDITIGSGDMYHPGGIDFDGTNVWVPVGEYRPKGKSMILTIDAKNFQVTERFQVKDSIGWALSNSETGSIYGGNWGSRQFYAWSSDGKELDRWKNSSSFIDYQDSQFVGNGQVICGGIANLPQSNGLGDYELGGMAIVDFANRQINYETPIQFFSSAGHVLTRNPFALTSENDDLFLHVAPDDGFDLNGTELLKFKACN